MEKNQSKRFKRQPWVTADGMGAAKASVGWAISTAIFGGGPAAYFVAVALSSIIR